MESDSIYRWMDNDPIHRWIAEVVPGRSFVDIGAIGEWSARERAGQAIAAGAASTAVADIQPAESAYWRVFHERMDGLGFPRDAYTSHAGVDVGQPDLAARLPASDVVHCTGVLYHCPDPIAAMRNLCGLAGRWLIVNTVVCPARVVNAAGSLSLPDGAALLVPGLSETERAVLRLHYQSKFGWDLDSVSPRPDAADPVFTYVTADGQLNWIPYWWLFTVPAFRGLLRLFRFEIRDEWTWEAHAHAMLCERVR